MSKRPAREITEELRQLAERPDSDRDRLSLLHEVHVYQEELIVQNEELLRARATLEETRDRLVELYDFAPNGYLSLDKNGVIVQINLTGAAILGRPRQGIEAMPLLGFIMNGDRSRFLDFLRACRESNGGDVTVEVRIMSAQAQRDVQLICKPVRSGTPDAALLTALIDISDRRQIEAERAMTAREHAKLASRLLSAHDEERQRIARELHDNLGQQVTALRLMLHDAQLKAVKQDVRTRIEQAQAIVEQLDRHLDFMSNELRPASLDLGLASALEQFVTEWSRTFGLPADVHCGGIEQLRLSDEVETHVYRVTQEALNNVYKHAQARRVSVVLERRGSDLVLIVEDDGRGFDAERQSREHGRGLGLIGMRERAQLVGGTIDIETAPKKGTTVYLHVPISGRTESR